MRGLGNLRKIFQILTHPEKPRRTWSSLAPPNSSLTSLLCAWLIIFPVSFPFFTFAKELPPPFLFSTQGPSLLLIPFPPGNFYSSFRSELKPTFLTSSTYFLLSAYNVPEIILGLWDPGLIWTDDNVPSLMGSYSRGCLQQRCLPRHSLPY